MGLVKNAFWDELMERQSSDDLEACGYDIFEREQRIHNMLSDIAWLQRQYEVRSNSELRLQVARMKSTLKGMLEA